MNKKFINVIILGFGFMLLFTAFQTMSNIEKTLLDTIRHEDKLFQGDGYISLAVIYASFSLCNWLAPSFIAFSGPRTAMLVGALIYTFFMVTFLYPITWLLYAVSALLGIGAAIIWTGQGTYLARCSDVDTIARNSGIFWALLQCSMFFGNIFVYFEFQNKEHIGKETRRLVIGVLTTIAAIGVIFLAMLRHMPDNTALGDSELQQRQTCLKRSYIAFCSAGKLLITRDMLLLSITFIYTGLALSFYSGVYGPSIGFTLKISKTPKEIMGLSGICIGAGEVFGGSLFGIMGHATSKYGRNPIVITGFIVHVMAYILIYLNLPNNAPFNDTSDISIFNPPIVSIALLCAGLLGFADACFNTQIYSMLGGAFVKQSVGAFALFKFFQSVAAAVAFVYSSHFGLRPQLIILVVFATLGTVCFFFVEWSVKQRHPQSSNVSATDTSNT